MAFYCSMFVDEGNSFDDDSLSLEADIELDRRRFAKHGKRGRPTLSKYSWPVFSDSIASGRVEFSFPRLDYWEEYMECIANDFLEAKQGPARPSVIIRLRNGRQSIEELARLADLGTVDLGQIERSIDYENTRKREATLFGLPEGIQDILRQTSRRCQNKEKSPEAQQPVPAKVKAVIIRLTTPASYSTIALKTRLSLSTVHRAVSSYQKNPELFLTKYMTSMENSSVFLDDTADRLRELMKEGSIEIYTAKDLATVLKPFVRETVVASGKTLVNAAKDQLHMRKLKCRVVAPAANQSKNEEAIKTVKLAMLRLFHDRGELLIFDCSTFKYSADEAKMWTCRGVKPSKRHKGTSLFFHLYCLISKHRVEAVGLSKASTTTESIRAFLYSSLRNIEREHRGTTTFKWLFMDNAPVHTDCMAEEISARFGIKVIFNVPRNPEDNPVEWYFGLVKAKFRPLCRRKESWGVLDVSASINTVTLGEYQSLLRKVCRQTMLSL